MRLTGRKREKEKWQNKEGLLNEWEVEEWKDLFFIEGHKIILSKAGCICEEEKEECIISEKEEERK